MSNQKKKSIIWLIEKDKLQEILNSSSSYCEVLDNLNLQSRNGNNAGTLKKRIEEDGLDDSVLNLNRENKRKEQVESLKRFNKRDFSSTFCIESSAYRSVIRSRIIKEDLIKYHCAICPNDGFHLGKPLSLHLDHINGVNNDNRLENLRFLCPNCHTQTETYAGKKAIRLCSCGNELSFRAKRCQKCMSEFLKSKDFQNSHPRKTKINWPAKEFLEKEVWEKTSEQIAKSLGISDTSFCKHLRKHGIKKPARGYWQKLNGSRSKT
jgi:ribosomal protein L40E